MSGKQSSGITGSSGSAYTPYEVTGSGTNSQGNNYDTREQPSGSACHYSNSDGSYYYANGNGSTYHNDAQGGSTYTAPNGNVTRK
ncbi:hypothetical protein VTL71DRAFT_13542 [Oculimacula yallundae]|uniref:Uncharacterized protein n=1 Tax=Oculimacula yallundae TaxID=86028 RepID=A0ABR4CMS5_9HELO